MRKIEHNRLLLLVVATLLILTHSSVVDGALMVAPPIYDPYKAALMIGNAGSNNLTGNAVSSVPSVASVVTSPLSTSSTAPITSQSTQQTPIKPSQSSSSDQSVEQSQTVQLQIPSPFDGVNSSYLQMTENDYQSLLANLTVIHGLSNLKGVQVKGVDSEGSSGNFLVIRIVDNVTVASAKPIKVSLDSKMAASLTKSSSQMPPLGSQAASSTSTPTPTSTATASSTATPTPTSATASSTATATPTSATATASSLQAPVPPGAPLSSPQASAKPLEPGAPVQNYSGATAKSALAAPATAGPNFSYIYPPSPAGYPPSMQPPFQSMYNPGYVGVSQLPPSQIPPSQLPPQSSSQGASTYQSNLGQAVPQPSNYPPHPAFWPGFNSAYQYQPSAVTYPSVARYGYSYQNYGH